MQNSLYVGNLASGDDRELGDLFGRFGVVQYAAFAADGERAGPPGRFGVVEMESEDAARAAIRVLDGFEIRGRVLTVRWATPPERTSCGRPAMFGAMNWRDGDEGDGAPR